MTAIPDKPSLEGLEAKWDAVWDAQQTYRFDRSKDRSEVYAIDTPPPTVSGQLHLGTVFGYVQVDAIARFHRMRGREVFYPMGWDDNGLPTERRVQNHFGVRCDPSLPYDPDLELGREPRQEAAPAPRLPAQLPRAVPAPDRGGRAVVRVGVPQRRSLGRLGAQLRHDRRPVPPRRPACLPAQPRPGRGLRHRGPHHVGHRLPDRRRPGRARGRGPPPARTTGSASAGADGGEPVEIETTRPELLPACVALVAHPDDERYQPLFGTEVVTPGVRRVRPRARPPPRRARQGLGHRDGLHLRRHGRRRVVARARPRPAGRRAARRALPAATRPSG